MSEREKAIREAKLIHIQLQVYCERERAKSMKTVEKIDLLLEKCGLSAEIRDLIQSISTGLVDDCFQARMLIRDQMKGNLDKTITISQLRDAS